MKPRIRIYFRSGYLFMVPFSGAYLLRSYMEVGKWERLDGRDGGFLGVRVPAFRL